MTKSTITREQLLEIIETDHVQCGEASYLARMALAAMDSEPVAYTDERNLGYIDRGRETAYLWGKQNSESSDVALYRHPQPAPVAQEKCPAEIRNLMASHSDELFNDDDAQEIWNACRAAMLAAAPHDTPALNSVQNVVTVPGKWIPVSERMPEDEQEVLTINKMGHRFVSFFDKHSGLFFDRLDAPAACCIEHVLVTHWMPLSAAPQEVKGE
ncbi:DUF551 domain-containing protein [Klebsiella variicola]|uniref:DUF551 domain-containing protein n=1 Tax=Klebsiella variicola TaxID=244366 RepID=UPI0010F756C6|nr:DUF551 domain-containing protein [Klebsiella variicola]